MIAEQLRLIAITINWRLSWQRSWALIGTHHLRKTLSQRELNTDWYFATSLMLSNFPWDQPSGSLWLFSKIGALNCSSVDLKGRISLRINSENMEPVVEQQPDVIPEKRWKTYGENYRYKEDKQYLIPAREMYFVLAHKLVHINLSQP